MDTPDQIRSERLKRAEQEDVLTALLHGLLTTSPSDTVSASPPGLDLLRSILSCDGHMTVPVLDLVAVLPDADFRELIGLHIASYYGHDSADRWYRAVLEQFFASGRGSLLALEDFNRHVGECHFFCLSADHPFNEAAARSAPKHLLTERMPFSPKQEKHKVTMKDRFSEYAAPVLQQIDKPATLAWICFGPSQKEANGSLRWAGSLFAVISADNAKDLRSSEVGNAIDYVYGILNASFYRTIVDRSRQEEEAHRLRLTYFAFGHDLKNRLARIDKFSILALRKKTERSAPELVPEIDQCHDLLQVLGGMCGVFGAVAKTREGRLPFAWIPLAKPRKKQLVQALVAAVQAFVHLEDSVETSEQRINLRRVNGSAKRIRRPDRFNAIALPPFDLENAEPSLCFLSGLAELCRNASRYVLDTPKMKNPHVDFSVEVSDDLVSTIVIYNPIVGDAKNSQSVRLLAELFNDFGNVNGKVVEIFPAQPVDAYAHGLVGYRYAESRFIYTPGNLRFEEDFE